MMSRLIAPLVTSALLLVIGSCGDDPDTSPSENPGNACTIDADCQDDMSISIWYPTCSDNVLQTPTGTGEKTCAAGACQTDFQLVDTNCEADDEVCGPNPDERTQGDACIEPG